MLLKRSDHRIFCIDEFDEFDESVIEVLNVSLIELGPCKLGDF